MMIVAFFRLDRKSVRVSKAVWVSFIWLLIASSRPISLWITFSTPDSAADTYIDGSPLDRSVLTVFMILAVVALSKRMRAVRAIVRENPFLVAYFLYCLLSLLWSDYPFVVFKRWFRSIGDVAMMAVIMTEPNWPDALKLVLTRLGYLLLPLSILFIRFYPSLGRAYSIGGAPMWTGVATDKNALGATAMLVGVTVLWRIMDVYRARKGKNRTRQLFSLGILFSMAVYLLLTADSQTALACFVMASLLIAFTGFARHFRKPTVVTLLVVTMVFVSGSILFLGIGGEALAVLGRNSTLTGRTQVWQTVLPFATNPLVGAGYENFWIGKRLRMIEAALGAGLNQAHNGYIEIYLNIGWLGLLLLSAFTIAGYRNILRELRRDPEMSRLKLAFFLICLVYNFTEAAFKMMSPVWMLFLWATTEVPIAALTRARSKEVNGRAFPVIPGRSWRVSSTAESKRTETLAIDSAQVPLRRSFV
jgi:O-antigen ligase